MSRPAVSRTIAGVLVAAAAVIAWQTFFPSEEKRVRRRLDQLVGEANRVVADQSLGVMAAARLSTYFTEDVVIEPGHGVQPLRGRETILALASRLRPADGSTRVDVKGVDVTVAPGGTSADATLAATITRHAGTAEATLDAHEFAVSLVKQRDEWQISRVAALDTLR